MRVIYKSDIVKKVEEAIRAAKVEKREIKEISLTPGEWSTLCRVIGVDKTHDSMIYHGVKVVKEPFRIPIPPPFFH